MHANRIYGRDVAIAALVVITAILPAVAAGVGEPLRCSAVRQEAEKEIRTAYTAISQAYANRDADGVMKYYAGGWVFRSALGVEAKKSNLDLAVRAITGSASQVTYSVSVLSLEVTGDRAKAAVRTRLDFTNVAGGAMEELAFDEVAWNHWVKTAEGWRMRSATERQSLMTQNGKRFKPRYPSETAETLKTFEKGYADMKEGTLEGDYKTFSAMLAPDYIFMKIEGVGSPPQTVFEFQESYHAKSQAYNWEIVNARVTGDSAVVLRKQHEVGFIEPDGSDEGEEVELVMDRTIRDTWQKTDGGWKLRTSEVLFREAKLGGKSSVAVLPEIEIPK